MSSSSPSYYKLRKNSVFQSRSTIFTSSLQIYFPLREMFEQSDSFATIPSPPAGQLDPKNNEKKNKSMTKEDDSTAAAYERARQEEEDPGRSIERLHL